MRPIALVLSVMLLVAGGAGATTIRSGLRGVVTRGPITPVCVPEQPCSAPAAGVVLVFSRSGREIARATSGRDGRYSVRLAPGVYVVRSPHRRMEPTVARVQRGRVTRIDFSIDTGIR